MKNSTVRWIENVAIENNLPICTVGNMYKEMSALIKGEAKIRNAVEVKAMASKTLESYVNEQY